MDGAISVFSRLRIRPTPTWGGVMLRSSSTCCAARASRNPIPVPCFQIHPACSASNHILKACATESGGVPGSNATAVWAAKLGMNLQSSTLKNDETGEAFHVQQAAQIRAYRAAWKEAGHAREPRVSVSRSIFALVDDRDHAYFGHERQEEDQVGFIDEKTRAIFGRSYAAEPDALIEQLRKDEAITEADTLLLTVPNQLGVAYNTHVIEAILTHIAPALGWR
jgi:hypothetical protein